MSETSTDETAENEGPGSNGGSGSRERAGGSDAGTVGAIMSNSLAATSATATASRAADASASAGGGGEGASRAQGEGEQGEASAGAVSGPAATLSGGPAAAQQAGATARAATGGAGANGAAGSGGIAGKDTSREAASRDNRGEARGEAANNGGGRDAGGGSSGGSGGEGGAGGGAAASSTNGETGAATGEAGAAGSAESASESGDGGGAAASGGGASAAAADAANAATQAAAGTGAGATPHVGESAGTGTGINNAGPTTTTTAPSHAPVSPVCFRPGTSIETPSGPVAIERLRPGDLVLTADGVAEPVLWIGRQGVDARRGDPLRVLPIRIRAGAIGPGLPARDLFLSPDHAVAIDGVLVHAGALVDGLAVSRQSVVPDCIDYLHVELARHCLILAEGLAAESFVDNLEQLAFDNWEEREALLGDRAPVPEMDLPRAKSARQVPQAIRRRLAARAALVFQAAPDLAA